MKCWSWCSVFTCRLKHLGHIEYEQRLRALGMCCMESRERDDLIQAPKVVKDLAVIQGHHGVQFQERGNEKY